MQDQQFYRSRQHSEGMRNIAWCSAVLTGINVAVFLLFYAISYRINDMGSFNVRGFFVNGQYYRIITSIFLHQDVNHLAGNMLLLYGVGEIVEKTIGKWRFLLLYFACGICGNLLTAAYEITTGDYHTSIGASGAVFGLVGGLLYLVITKKGKAVQITITRMLLMIVLSLYSGFVSPMVNNAAHLGGLLSGFVIIFILCHIGHRFTGPVYEGGMR